MDFFSTNQNQSIVIRIFVCFVPLCHLNSQTIVYFSYPQLINKYCFLFIVYPLCHTKLSLGRRNEREFAVYMDDSSLHNERGSLSVL